MAHSLQAQKRRRQSEKRRLHNRSVQREIKTLTKTLGEKVSARDVEGAKALLKLVTAKLDKAAKNHIYHQNSVARQKSKNARLVNSLG